MALSNTAFPCFKSTGDDKHDIDIYTEDLKDYCDRTGLTLRRKLKRKGGLSLTKRSPVLEHPCLRPLEQFTNTAWD